MIDQHAGCVFILGCERSGSTWVSNVLDAHSNIEFYMEPFADYAGLFPGFPSRNLYLDAKNDDLAGMVRARFQQLSRIKYALTYNAGRNISFKYLDRSILLVYKMLGAVFKCRQPKTIEQFQLLNLNLLKIPVYRQTRKSSKTVVVATKELRLNLKIGFLKKTFPDMKVLLVVRDPGAQITSIVSQFKKGGLGELNRSLQTFFDYVRSNPRFEKYWRLIDDKPIQDDQLSKLVLWWLINYEILIEDCKRNDVDFTIVYHEDISENSSVEFDKILTYIGVEASAEVKNYLTVSTSTKSSIISSPVDTNRNSKVYYKEVLEKVDYELKEKIRNIQAYINVSPELYRYFQ